MKHRILSSLVLSALLVLAVPWAGPVLAQGSEEGASSSVIYLVRHAEKADDDPRDPTLTEQGRERAVFLARTLADVPLASVFSTDYQRTRETAAPVADGHGLQIQAYRYVPGSPEWEAFVAMLQTTPGHHLVVGHSNTTPSLVRWLGGDPVSAISEMEYDRLYVVTVSGDGTVNSTLLRVGPPSPEPAH